jgi:hypothetical protein
VNHPEACCIEAPAGGALCLDDSNLAHLGGKVADMRIAEWWPKLDSDAQAWLIAHNGEAVTPDVMSQIVAVAGSVREVGESGPDGVFLTDEAVDWIEATANDESD